MGKTVLKAIQSVIVYPCHAVITTSQFCICRIKEKDREIVYLNERCQSLKSEVRRLKNTQPDDSGKISKLQVELCIPRNSFNLFMF